MEETTHDSSSSSSRKSEEKCPPAGGIKMKIGGFKTGHCYHKPSDAAIQHEPSGVSSRVWLPRLSLDDFDRVVQTTPFRIAGSFRHVFMRPRGPLQKNSHIHAQRHSCHII